MSDTCPKCKIRKEDYPSVKFMVSECFHQMCDICVNHYFVAGMGNCPECQLPLRQQSFHERQYEDAYVEKDIQIRKRILRDYNKQEEDFESFDAYNNYLEEVETIIHNLCNDIDVDGTKERIRKYKEENRQQIARNRNRLSRARQELDDMLAIEGAMQEKRNRELFQMHAEKREREQENMEAMLDELALGKDANKVVRKYAERVDKTSEWDYMPPPKPWALNNEQVCVWRHEMRDNAQDKRPTDNKRMEQDSLIGAFFKTHSK